MDTDTKIITEREYQTRAVREILHQTIGLSQRTMFQLATGAGKTQIATRVMEQVVNNLDLAVMPLTGERIFDNSPKASEGVIFMCHRIELIKQAQKTFTEAGLPVHMSYDIPSSYGSNDIYKRGMVNIQSAGKIAGKRSRKIPFPSYLVVDEAHHAPAASWSRVLKSHNGQVLGLTATPWRLSPRQHFLDLFDVLITGKSIGASTQDLVNQGYLVEPAIMVPDEIVKYLPGDIVAGDVSMSRLSDRLGISLVDIPLDEWFRRAYYGRRRPLKTLFFAATQDIAIQQTQALNENGIRAGALLSDEELASISGLRKYQYDREMVVHDFETNQLDAIVNCNIVSEGFDVPAVECVVIGRPTKSLAMYRQMIGRAMRPSPGKKLAMVIDCGGSVKDPDIGSPMHEPMWSLQPRVDTPSTTPPIMKTCELCETLNWSASHNCMVCNEPFGKDCKRCNIWRSFKDYRPKWANEYIAKGEKPIGYADNCDLCVIEERENARRAERMQYAGHVLARPTTMTRMTLYDYNAVEIARRGKETDDFWSSLMVVNRQEEYQDANRIHRDIGEVINPILLKFQERESWGISYSQKELVGVVLANTRLGASGNEKYYFCDRLRDDDIICISCNRVHRVIPKADRREMVFRGECAVMQREIEDTDIQREHLDSVFPVKESVVACHPHGLQCYEGIKDYFYRNPPMLRLDNINGTFRQFEIPEKVEVVETEPEQLGMFSF